MRPSTEAPASLLSEGPFAAFARSPGIDRDLFPKVWFVPDSPLEHGVTSEPVSVSTGSAGGRGLSKNGGSTPCTRSHRRKNMLERKTGGYHSQGNRPDTPGRTRKIACSGRMIASKAAQLAIV